MSRPLQADSIPNGSGEHHIHSHRIFAASTRERVMAGQPQAAPLLELAERAERLGFDSVWAGDSLRARPRHEPVTRLAAVASRVRRVDIGTAVLLLPRLPPFAERAKHGDTHLVLCRVCYRRVTRSRIRCLCLSRLKRVRMWGE